MTAKQESPREAPCTRCGKPADCSFADPEKLVIEVVCADCGRFQVPSADFEMAEFEIVEPSEPGE
jgi:hypothetical protein